MYRKRIIMTALIAAVTVAAMQTAAITEKNIMVMESTTAEEQTTTEGYAYGKSVREQTTTAEEQTTTAEEQTTTAEGQTTTAEEETTADTEQTTAASTESTTAGYIGRLIISSAGIDVALISAPINDSSVSQAVVDAEDSAAYMVSSSTVYIADHNYQDFKTLKEVSEGDTGQIVTDTGVIELVCTSVLRAYNTGSALVDADGNRVSLGAYTCYTCLDSTGYAVYVAAFEVV